MRFIILLLAFMLTTNAYAAAVTFTDDSGETFNLPEVPAKVVVLNSSNLELFIAAGGQLSAYGESGTMPKYLEGHIQGLPSVGTVQNPDIERIVNMKPDLVIGMNFPFHIALKPSLQQAGIPLAVFNVQNRDDLIDKMDVFGRITGKPEQAAARVHDINTAISTAQTRVGSGSRRVLVVYGTPESFNMALPKSFIGEMTELAGGINVAPKNAAGGNGMMNGFAPISLEYVTMANPDMILVITHNNATAIEGSDLLSKLPAWNSLQAVKNERVYNLPFDTYGINPTVRLGTAVLELSALIYPELYQ